MHERLADVLDLTDEQRTQIETIRTELRDAIRARHDEAREAFRALLTTEQLEMLDAFEARRDELVGHFTDDADESADEVEDSDPMGATE